MPTTVTLQPDFFDPFFLILLLGLILLISGLVKFFRWNKERRAIKKQQKMLQAQTMQMRAVPAQVKARYTDQLRQLGNRITVGSIPPRTGYQQMSLLVRTFVKEYANLDVTTKTLAEIRSMGLPELTALVEEYYAPEFSPDEIGDVQKSITVTIKAINKWK